MLQNLEINGKVVDLHFGLGFIRQFDNEYKVTQNGLKFGQGIEVVTSRLLGKDPLVLVEIIKAATTNSKEKPNREEIDAFIESQDDLDGLFEDFLDELSTNAMTKGKAQAVKDRVRKAQEEEEMKKE